MTEQKLGAVDPAVELFKRLARLDNLTHHDQARDTVISLQEITMALADQIRAPRERHRAEFRKIVGTDADGRVTTERLAALAAQAGVTIATGGVELMLELLNGSNATMSKTTGT